MALGIRLEAIAFRFTILVAVTFVLLFLSATGMALDYSRTAQRRAEAADSAFAADTLACPVRRRATSADKPLRLSELLKPGLCDSEEIASRAQEVRQAYSFARADRQRASEMAIFAIALPFMTFLAFYLLRWLLTGRFTPVWPLHEREAGGVAVADEMSPRRAP